MLASRSAFDSSFWSVTACLIIQYACSSCVVNRKLVQNGLIGRRTPPYPASRTMGMTADGPNRIWGGRQRAFWHLMLRSSCAVLAVGCIRQTCGASPLVSLGHIPAECFCSRSCRTSNVARDLYRPGRSIRYKQTTFDP